MGPEKKKLLTKLPSYFSEFLEENEAIKTKNLWNVCYCNICKYFNHSLSRCTTGCIKNAKLSGFPQKNCFFFNFHAIKYSY